MPLDKKLVLKLGAQAIIKDLESQLREARRLAQSNNPSSAASSAQSKRMKAWWKKKKAADKKTATAEHRKSPKK